MNKLKILATYNSPNKNWCFASSVKSIMGELKDTFDFTFALDTDKDVFKTTIPDVVWSRCAMCSLPLIWGEHPNLINKAISTVTLGGEMFDGWLNRESYYIPRIQGFVVQNNDIKTRLEHVLSTVGLNKIVRLIPVSVDTTMFTPRKSSPKEFCIGFSGRRNTANISSRKGYDLAVKVSEIMGVPLKVSSKQTGEFIPHSGMGDWFRSISVLVLPSISEGCSNVVMEAMACGVPVITTMTGYHGEECVDGENILFAGRNVWQIVQKVALVRDNPSLAGELSKNGVSFARKHSVETISKEYVKLFNDVFERTVSQTKEDVMEDVAKWNSYCSKHSVVKVSNIRTVPKEHIGGNVIIKYLGKKSYKKVMREGKEYLFNPTAFVDDSKVAEWLLSPDMRGLFKMEGERVKMVDEKDVEKLTKPMKTREVNKVDDSKHAPKEKVTFDCEYCGFKAKSYAGLVSHKRVKHKDENDQKRNS